MRLSLLLSLAAGTVLAVRPAAAFDIRKAPRRPACVEVRDPGVGSYRICPPAPRRR